MYARQEISLVSDEDGSPPPQSSSTTRVADMHIVPSEIDRLHRQLDGQTQRGRERVEWGDVDG